jgi:acetylornithine deacetylase/succinyl-diaminopimelate desuccinylase-like protein
MKIFLTLAVLLAVVWPGNLEGLRDGPASLLVGVEGLRAAPAVLASQDAELRRLEDEAVSRVQEYLRIDTINPPGNETRGVEYLARLLAAEGIKYETAESAPGRGNIWARLDGGPEPALVLLHHIDVVPADPRYWKVDPLSGALKNGYVYGRGALDTKGLGILHLQAFIALHRSGQPLRRPVIFMATADEEAGGAYGAGWLVEHRPDLFKGAGMLLNEGGGGGEIGARQVFEIEVTQKVPLWLRFIARDVPGHGSTPRATSSVGRIVRALERLRAHEFTPRLLPAVDAYFRGRAGAGIGPFAKELKEPATAIRQSGFLAKLQLEDPYLAALTRNACSITRLEGSDKINVVPPQASAEVDCRLLPDQDVDAFIAELRTVLGDPAIEIERIMAFSPAVSSTDTDLYRAIESVTRRYFPAATVLPSMQTGFTDSHFFRDRGIASYGYSPFLVPPEDEAGVHGNDERVTVENIRRGTRVMLEIVRAVAGR